MRDSLSLFLCWSLRSLRCLFRSLLFDGRILLAALCFFSFDIGHHVLHHHSGKKQFLMGKGAGDIGQLSAEDSVENGAAVEANEALHGFLR